MKKVRGALVALGAAALMVVPATAAHADTTVGGGTVGAGPCDVTLASVTFNDSGQVTQVTVGHVDC